MLDDDDLLGFPCDFPIKVMGLRADDFAGHVTEIVRAHAVELRDEAVTCRQSRKGTYVSVTVRIRATGREQVDAIYRDVTDDERVLFAL